MTVVVNVELDREFTVSADKETVFELLADVPKSGSHFPRVKALTNQGKNIFLWEMEKVGLGEHAFQTVYACKYIPDESEGTVIWEQVKGIGNSIVSGSWEITESSDGTNVKFVTNAKMTLPLPWLLKIAISPVVKHEFNSMVDEYIDNLKSAFA